MTGDDRVRACGQCRRDVFNLSAMTREQAEQLLVERTGRLCVRYYRRADGTILTADCPVGTRNKRRRRWVAAGLGALAAIGGAINIYKWTRPAGAHVTGEMGQATLGEAHMVTSVPSYDRAQAREGWMMGGSAAEPPHDGK
jgi:hypothetical protein